MEKPSKFFPRLSLEVKLPLLISLLLFVVLATGVLLAGMEIRRSAVDAANNRLRLVTQQLSDMVALSVEQGESRLTQAASNPETFRLLGGGGTRAGLETVFASVEAPVNPAVESVLMDSERRIILALGDGQVEGTQLTPRDVPSEGGLGSFILVEDRPHYWVSAPVEGPDGPLGYISELRRFGEGNSVEEIEALIGSGISLFLANADSGPWFTLDGGSTPAPPEWPFGASARFDSSGEETLGVQSGIPGTPFAVIAQQPMRTVLSSADAFLRRSWIAAFFLTLAGAGGAWILSRRITSPVLTLVAGTEAIVAGDYGHRIRLRGNDELGILGARFNWMADHVESTHGLLSDRVNAEHSRVLELERSRRAEAEAAERRVADILESISDGFIAFDPTMKVRFLNAAAETLLGRDRQSVLSKQLLETFPALLDTPFYKGLEEVLTHHQPVDLVISSMRQEGVWLEVHLVPISEGVAAFIRDITHRKEAEVRLEMMRAAVEASADGMAIMCEKGLFVYANQAEAELYGFESSAELVGQSWEILYDDEQRARIEKEFSTVFESSDHWLGEAVARRKDGTSFPQEFSITHLDGVGYVRVERDITERAQSRLALQLSEELVRQLTEYIESVFWMMDAHKDHLLYVSPAYERIWGSPVQELYRNPDSWIDHVHPMDRERVMMALPLRETGEYDIEFRIVRPDGVIRWIRDRAYPISSPDGVVYRVAGLSEDVTDRREVENALRAATNEAERANQSKSEFLSRMSHELRTPMNAILGFAQLLELDAKDPGEQEGITHILRAGRHLLLLIDDVLRLSRIEAGEFSISPEPISVNELARNALDLVAPMAAEHRITMSSEPTDLVVLADQQRLNQVLLNLLSNAIKYGRVGGKIRIGFQKRGERLRILVADNGIGIPASKGDQVFMPFQRLGAERTEIEGTGLGLALSKGLIEAMNGTIGFESTEGVGSTFWVELPITSRFSDHFEVEEIRPSLAPGSRGLEQQAKTILYIEDNLSNVNLMERLLLRRPEIKLIPAMQGRLGLELAEKYVPDLILLDLHLPDIQGDRLLERFRAHPLLAGIPVIIISADATERQAKRLSSAGAFHYLTKPFDVQRLLTVIDEALGSPA